MTRYSITYTIKGSELVKTASIVERDEQRAKKMLRAYIKEDGDVVEEIRSITVERENVSASKALEYEALEEIKAIIKSLGEGSYLATAFAGCFEDAENNIEDDAAYSMKDRWESAERKLAEAEKNITSIELDNRDLRIALDRVKQEAADAQQALRDKTLAPDDMTDIQQLIDETIYDLDSRVKAAAQAIVKYADDPASPEFQQAVSSHRSLGSRLDYYRALNSRIIAAMKAGA